jgi:hypothetical protein
MIAGAQIESRSTYLRNTSQNKLALCLRMKIEEEQTGTSAKEDEFLAHVTI